MTVKGPGGDDYTQFPESVYRRMPSHCQVKGYTQILEIVYSTPCGQCH